MILHGYFRSSAAYRVRIALNLKSVEVEHRSHHLLRGEQRDPAYLALNPQGLVPALELDDGRILTQSLAIIFYLDAVFPDPALLPADPVRSAEVQAFAQAIACDTHPLQNLRVLKRVSKLTGSKEQAAIWARAVASEGLAACEALIADEKGPFCFGGRPTLADICLIPQLANARRFEVDLTQMPRLIDVEAACLALPAFAEAVPERQPDSE
jgi:maleylpyruvate isomerase